jgi:hypothetical protein
MTSHASLEYHRGFSVSDHSYELADDIFYWTHLEDWKKRTVLRAKGKILYTKYQGFIVASTADQRLFVPSLLPKEMRPWTAGALRELF